MRDERDILPMMVIQYRGDLLQKLAPGGHLRIKPERNRQYLNRNNPNLPVPLGTPLVNLGQEAHIRPQPNADAVEKHDGQGIRRRVLAVPVAQLRDGRGVARDDLLGPRREDAQGRGARAAVVVEAVQLEDGVGGLVDDEDGHVPGQAAVGGGDVVEGEAQALGGSAAGLELSVEDVFKG